MCVSRWRTVTDSLPAAANSGQYVATGASMSTSPRSARTCNAVAVTPLVVEKLTAIVSSAHCRAVLVAPTAPHVDHLLATVIHAQRPTEPAIGVQVLRQQRGESAEVRLDRSVEQHPTTLLGCDG